MQVSLAQTKVSLLDENQVKEYLTLSDEQSEKINLKINSIKQILDEDYKIISDLKERFNSGDEPGFFEKISVKRGRDKRADNIKNLIEDIEDQLTNEQKMKFKNVDKPFLKPLSKDELTK
jgi:hypothetical protein